MQENYIRIPELDEETVKSAINQIKIPQDRDLCFELKTKGICSYK